MFFERFRSTLAGRRRDSGGPRTDGGTSLKSNMGRLRRRRRRRASRPWWRGLLAGIVPVRAQLRGYAPDASGVRRLVSPQAQRAPVVDRVVEAVRMPVAAEPRGAE